MKKVIFVVLSVFALAACNMPQAKAETVLPIFLPTAQNAEIWPKIVNEGLAFQDLCGGKRYIINLADTSDSQVSVEAGFYGETSLETHLAPSGFDTLCYHIEVKKDETSQKWYLEVNLR